MTKAKAYYQAYLVLDCLSDEEYSLIPDELLEEIESKMEVDESIKVDSSIPLEKQKIDEKAYDILEKVIKAIEKNYGRDAIDNPDKYADKAKPKKKKSSSSKEIFEDDERKVIEKPKLEVERRDIEVEQRIQELQNENIKLKSIIKALEEENKKIEKAKELVIDYKGALSIQEEKNKKLKNEIDKLQQSNDELYESISKMPKILRKIFIKDYTKLLRTPSDGEGIVLKIDDSK